MEGLLIETIRLDVSRRIVTDANTDFLAYFYNQNEEVFRFFIFLYAF